MDPAWNGSRFRRLRRSAVGVTCGVDRGPLAFAMAAMRIPSNDWAALSDLRNHPQPFGAGPIRPDALLPIQSTGSGIVYNSSNRNQHYATIGPLTNWPLPQTWVVIMI